jgi:hypothetical protein
MQTQTSLLLHLRDSERDGVRSLISVGGDFDLDLPEL